MKVNQRRLAKILAESAFTPSEPGPLRVIMEQGSPDYYEMRAMEMVAEARLAIKDTPSNTEAYAAKMRTAISLLALARAEREPEEKPTNGPTEEVGDTRAD